MPEQLTFDLPFRTAMGRADFFVSEANAAAVQGIEAWTDWPHSKMLLVGPEGAGKTHLAHVWADLSGAQVIAASDLTEEILPSLSEASALAVEDVDRMAGDRDAETWLFHLHNAMAHRAAPLLITARAPSSRWRLVLPDLASRMAQAGQVSLDAPDDALLSAMMVKLATDRGLTLSPRVVGFALPRIERSFAAIRHLISELDARTLVEKSSPSTRHIREILSLDD